MSVVIGLLMLLFTAGSTSAQNCQNPQGDDVHRCQSIVRQQSYAAALAQCDWDRGQVVQWLQEKAARVAELEKRLDGLDKHWRER